MLNGLLGFSWNEPFLWGGDVKSGISFGEGILASSVQLMGREFAITCVHAYMSRVRQGLAHARRERMGCEGDKCQCCGLVGVHRKID